MNNFWQGKKVLITGHTGFKGSWLCLFLKVLGAEITGYALDPLTCDDNFEAVGLSNKVVDIRADIRDYETLLRVFSEHKPEIVFHLAAQPLVGTSYEKPKETYDINVMGTLNILEGIRSVESIRAGIIITTDKCYDNKEHLWGYREIDALGGYDPYSSSKACAEILSSSYRDSFFNLNDFDKHKKAIATARAGNVIGGGDWAMNRLVPDCVRWLAKGEKIMLRSPDALRPWQHVIEPVYGYLTLAEMLYKEPLKYSGAWNFGPDVSSIYNVTDITEMIVRSWGGHGEIGVCEETFHEANLLLLDSTKANMLLGWKSLLSAPETIDWAVKWYKHYKKGKMYDFGIGQVKRYLEIAENA